MEVISRKDALKQGLKLYFTNKPCNKGHVAPRFCSNSVCRDCSRARRQGEKNTPRKEAAKRGEKRYFTGQPCKRGHIAERLVSNRRCVGCLKTDEHIEKVRKDNLSYRQRYREELNAYRRNWAKENKERVLFHNASRRCKTLQRTLPGFEDEILELFYERERLSTLFGRTYHVDHVVPLESEYVSGLHVPWNLQVIPAEQNLSKRNKFTPYVEYY